MSWEQVAPNYQQYTAFHAENFALGGQKYKRNRKT